MSASFMPPSLAAVGTLHPQLEHHLYEVNDCEPLLEYLHSNRAISEPLLEQIRSLSNVHDRMRLLLTILMQEKHDDSDPTVSDFSSNALGLLINVLRIHGYLALASVLDNGRPIQMPLERSSIHSLAGYQSRTPRRRGQISIILQVSAIRVSASQFGLDNSTMIEVTDSDGSLDQLSSIVKDDAAVGSTPHTAAATANHSNTIWIENPAIQPSKLYQSMMSRSLILLSSGGSHNSTEVTWKPNRPNPSSVAVVPTSPKGGGCFVQFLRLLLCGLSRKGKKKIPNQELPPFCDSPVAAPRSSCSLHRKSHSENEIVNLSNPVWNEARGAAAGDMAPKLLPTHHHYWHNNNFMPTVPPSTPFVKAGPPCSQSTPLQVRFDVLPHPAAAFGDGLQQAALFEVLHEEVTTQSTRQKKASILTQVSSQVYELLQPTSLECSLPCMDGLSRFIQQDCGVLLLNTIHDADAVIVEVCCTHLLGLKSLYDKIMDGSMAMKLERRLFTAEIMQHHFAGVNDIRLSIDLNAREYDKAQRELSS